VKYLLSFLVGGLTATGGVFLHLSYPPAGLFLALAGSAATFWSIGRRYGKRRFKVVALLGWLIVINDATTFGDGGELLVQGDSAGMTFLASALTIVVVSIFLPVKD
jgi:peptidoglycan/LPS O-acetylase OafA/YrhL